MGLLKELNKIYSHLDEDLRAAMVFYHPAWKEVMTDTKLVKEFLKSEGEYIIQEKHGQVVEQAGVLRRSLG